MSIQSTLAESDDIVGEPLDHPLRAVHVASGDLWGGAEAQILELTRALNRRPDMDVATIVLNHGKLAYRLRAEGIPTTVLDESRLGPLRLLLSLRAAIGKSEVDIVHTHRTKENVMGALGALMCGLPSLRTVHGGTESRIPFYRVDKKLIGTTDWLVGRYIQAAVIPVSADLAARRLNRMPSRKIHIIQNGISVDEVRAAAGRAVQMPARAGALRLCFVGRLVPVKRVDRILDSLRILLDRHPGRFDLAIVGEGPELPDLLRRAARLRLESTVHFVGFQDCTPAWIAGSDILVLASEHEGLPMTVLEALALGVPPVVPPVGDLRILIGAARLGRVSESSDPEHLAEAILSINAPDETKPRESSLPAQWTIEATAEAVATLYLEVVQLAGARHGRQRRPHATKPDA